MTRVEGVGPYSAHVAYDKTSADVIQKGQVTLCEKCGGPVYVGDWPLCEGNEEDHNRAALAGGRGSDGG